MSEIKNPIRTHNVRVYDLIDLALMCLEFKKPVMAEFIILMMPKIGKADIDEYFKELTMMENTKDDIEEDMFILQEMLEKDGKWNYDI